MSLFRGKRIEHLDSEIASFADGEAAKIDRCVRVGDLAIITGWTTEAPDFLIPGTFFSERYRRDDVEREIGPTGMGFIKACHLPSSTEALDLQVRVRGKRYRGRIAISDDPETLAVLGMEQERFLGALSQAACQMLPEAAEAFVTAFGNSATHIAPLENELAEIAGSEALTAERPARSSTDTAEAAIDEVIAVGDQGFLVVGWCIDASPDPEPLSLSLKLGDQPSRAVDLLTGAFRVARPDLLDALGPAIRAQASRAGFLRYLRAPGTDTVANEALLERAGCPIGNPELPAVKRFDDALTATHELLKHLHPRGQSMLDLLDGHLGPAIQDLSFRKSSEIEADIIGFGPLPEKPSVSIIIPVYGRYDLVEFQLSQFANDPEFHTEVDLIYVLDDPTLHDAFLECCGAVAPIYEVPFRCVTYPGNLGFAGANNVGIRHSRCDWVLLLNSDVLPNGTGWVSGLRERFESVPDCGTLGARLLYPDGAIQHDGMSFKRLPSLAGLWINDHPGKGLPAIPVESDNSVAAVPAVTAACVMLAKDDLVAIGGLDEGFILGDFEDSDLCLALRERGKRSYIARDIVLYHLERQSQSLFEDRVWRDKVTVYNCWRHHRKWEPAIERLSGGQSV